MLDVAEHEKAIYSGLLRWVGLFFILPKTEKGTRSVRVLPVEDSWPANHPLSDSGLSGVGHESGPGIQTGAVSF
jgi:hypothetical protein